MVLLDFFKKLRSRKVRMIDGESELDLKKPRSIPMFLNATEISEVAGQKMIDIAKEHKPELTHNKK